MTPLGVLSQPSNTVPIGILVSGSGFSNRSDNSIKLVDEDEDNATAKAVREDALTIDPLAVLSSLILPFTILGLFLILLALSTPLRV